MKKIVFLVLLFVFSAQAKVSIKGLHCGTRGTFLGTLASDIAIPDYFPPEKFLARVFLSPFFPDMSVCEQEYDSVYLGQSCQAHDECYQTLGADKDACDDDLLVRWHETCAERYQGYDETSSHCQNACESFTSFMYDALRFNSGGLCPSCVAYERDQEKARRMSIYKEIDL